MIVGFTITDFNGGEQAAVDYIQKVCILESPSIAQNIVSAGPGVNIFSKNVTTEELRTQPFSSKPIEIPEGKCLVASEVNFAVELLYNNTLVRLLPTEYIIIEPTELTQFKEYIHQGIVKTVPENFGGKWILDNGVWDDSGVWVDTDNWRDN